MPQKPSSSPKKESTKKKTSASSKAGSSVKTKSATAGKKTKKTPPKEAGKTTSKVSKKTEGKNVVEETQQKNSELTSSKAAEKNLQTPNQIAEESAAAASRSKDELAEELFGDLKEVPQDKAEMYDELIAQELERELIRSQRKQMAGKDQVKKEVKKFQPLPPVKPVFDRVVEISEVISVKEFAEKTGLGAAKVIGELMRNGILANINQQIDPQDDQLFCSRCQSLLSALQPLFYLED